MAVLVRDPLASRTQLVFLPADGGSVRSLLYARCEALVSSCLRVVKSDTRIGVLLFSV